MSITIKLNQILRRFTNHQDVVQVNGGTVRECLDNLSRKYPAINNWLFDRNGILMTLVLLNGDTITQEELDRPVTAGSELQLIYIVGGG
jgi:molybdopterin converting factor small subunit